jgi:hypothetical protein
VVPATSLRRLDISVSATGAIDCVDILRNNVLVKRFSPCDVPRGEPDRRSAVVRTHVYLEVGWGKPGKPVQWEVTLSLSDGRVEAVEPRFRGRQILSPLDHGGQNDESLYASHCTERTERTVRFVTETRGNPNPVTNTNQGVCLQVAMPLQGEILLDCNGNRASVPLRRLLERTFTGSISGDLAAPAWRLHRAPLPWEWDWWLSFSDRRDDRDERDVYMVRVRQGNDQWAWSSPIFVGGVQGEPETAGEPR